MVLAAPANADASTSTDGLRMIDGLSDAECEVMDPAPYSDIAVTRVEACRIVEEHLQARADLRGRPTRSLRSRRQVAPRMAYLPCDDRSRFWYCTVSSRNLLLPRGGSIICSSDVFPVSMDHGDVVYAGPTCDEG